jgi:NifU-like protein involved in Fe-S cluster formation
MYYNELTRHHFAAASAGVLTGPGVHRGAAGSRTMGTWVQFDVQIDSSDGVVRLRAATFLAYACPHVIAVADWVAQHAVGREVSPALPESLASLQQRFGVPIHKLGRLLVVEDAWIAAVAAPS